MNELQKVFDDQQINIVEKDGDVFFLLRDVCSILELGQVAGVKRRLDEDVISNHPLQTAGGTQKATFVNEDGLYDVILDSRKPEAKRFRKWITSEVIPSIRKTGGYQHVKVLTPEEQLKASMKLTLEASEEIGVIKKKVVGLEERFDNELTLTHGQAVTIQYQVKKRVEHLWNEGLRGTLESKHQMYMRIHSQLKRAFQAPTYREIKRIEYNNAVGWIKTWRPL